MAKEIPDLLRRIRLRFGEHGIMPTETEVREFPGETIVVVYVSEVDFGPALEVSSKIDAELQESTFVVVRKSLQSSIPNRGSIESIRDPRVTRLVELLNERSRTSEQQPSLQYIPDAAANASVAITRRHHVIFGRRGVGKTALLLEAKRRIEERGDKVVWQNMQSVRGLDVSRAFLTVAHRICNLPAATFQSRSAKPLSLQLGEGLVREISDLLNAAQVPKGKVAVLIPQIQEMLRVFCDEQQKSLFIFLDDIHYMAMGDMPDFLDFIHGTTRDTSAWLKIAGIRHQCRLFVDSPPKGLQIGHDIAVIDLDITLEEPAKARKFLFDVLRVYLDGAGISNISGCISSAALDRLVLASGGVPRDFLVLAAKALQIARGRAKARTVGIQDVNEAAGQTALQKTSELEDDAATSVGAARQRLSTLETIRAFALEEKHCSFFKVSFREKERLPQKYRLLQSLMDLRMIHLMRSSVSDSHHAGERYEVYMLDLSQFTGARLKQQMRMLDLKGDGLIVRKTGTNEEPMEASTPRQLITLLRSGPTLGLDRLGTNFVLQGQ